MLPTKSEIFQQGDLGGEKVAMQLDSNGLAHIMSVLTDLYSDPELAIIREYSTNAWDSHVEAGTTEPIEVNTPTGLNSNFSVRDYGVGLSRQDIIDIYSKYGASTKRGTNDQTGMLGLGCKSALTYTNQFNIKSVKDGVQLFVAVSRDASGAGSMEIISETPTSARDGVEIIVPAKSYNSLDQKAKEFFKYWQPGRVKLNGKFLEIPDHIEITNRVWMITGEQKSYIMMGGVPYLIEEDNGYYYGRQYGLVIFADIGEVNFTPSRESLHYTALTKATINKYNKEFVDNVQSSFQKQIEQAKNHYEALMIADTWRKFQFNNAHRSVHTSGFIYQYRNEAIPTKFEFDFQYEIGYGTFKNRTDAKTIVQTSDLVRNTIITGFSLGELTSHHKAKIRRYAEENGLGSRFLLCDKMPNAKWLSGLTTINWADVNKVKFARSTAAKQTKYTVYNIDRGIKEDVNALDTTKQLVYANASEHKDFSYSWRNVFGTTDYQFVIVSNAKKDKFLKNYPQAIHYLEAIKSKVKTFFDKLPEDDLMRHTLGYYELDFLKRLDANEIDDPVLKRAIRLSQTKNSSTDQNIALMIGLAQLCGLTVNNTSVSVLSKYVLINTSMKHKEHVVFYLNAAYNKFFKETK